MKTFQRVIADNSKAFMMLICILVAAKRMLKNTGFLEVYTELQNFSLVLPFLLKYLTIHTLNLDTKLISLCVSMWRMDSDVLIFTILSVNDHCHRVSTNLQLINIIIIIIKFAFYINDLFTL
jgi:hypothetical protein